MKIHWKLKIENLIRVLYNKCKQGGKINSKTQSIKEIVLISLAVIIIALATYFIYQKYYAKKTQPASTESAEVDYQSVRFRDADPEVDKLIAEKNNKISELFGQIKEINDKTLLVENVQKEDIAVTFDDNSKVRIVKYTNQEPEFSDGNFSQISKNSIVTIYYDRETSYVKIIQITQ